MDDRLHRTNAAQLVFAVAGPLLVVVAAYALWWVSDRLRYVGQLDRAAFGWLVVIPLWLAAPVVAGFAWRRLDARGAIAAAIGLGTVVGLAAAVLSWQAVVQGQAACTTAPVRVPADWIGPSIVVGAVLGGSLLASSLVAATPMRDGRWLVGTVAGLGLGVLLLFASIASIGVLFLAQPMCQRPIPAG